MRPTTDQEQARFGTLIRDPETDNCSILLHIAKVPLANARTWLYGVANGGVRARDRDIGFMQHRLITNDEGWPFLSRDPKEEYSNLLLQVVKFRFPSQGGQKVEFYPGM